jgi:two-component system, NtrC family, sensor histidine kinase KinB
MKGSPAMFGLKQKLILGFGALLVIIVGISALSIFNVTRLGGSIDVILRENFRSVVACQQMKEALERMDSGTLFTLLGEQGAGADLVAGNRAAFETALQVELNTITLPGEGEKAVRLKGFFREYVTVLAEVSDATRSQSVRKDIYFGRLLPLFMEIKGTSDEILQMNQANMHEANERARAGAASARKQMFAMFIAGIVISTGFVVLTGRWILSPINRLIESADEIRRGNLDLVVPSGSRDEIGHLSAAFNAMTASLREFRRSNQAKWIRVQQATQRAFDNLPAAVAVLDTEGRVEVATAAAKRIFGLGPAVSVRELPFKWMSGLVQEAVASGRSARLEDAGDIIQSFFDGNELYFRPEAVPILDADKQTIGVILVFQDVTQLRQQAEIKRDLISTVSHQLKTPLTSIRMAIHLVLDEKVGPLTDKQAELLVAAREDSDRLNDILARLLDISRIESGKAPMELKAVAPVVIVSEAVQSFRREAQDRGVTLGTDIPDDLPDVLVDKDRIEHVFTNLLSNALRYTPAGGRVGVSAVAESDKVVFSISDTGAGIPERYLPQIFDKFFRVPDQVPDTGAGLGLAIVKELVEAHGGTVSVSSREGEGSKFSFSLCRAGFPVAEECRP